ncbi:MAG: hypothetical protein Q8L22_30415 [Reyranella sp.]|nr:hypothetical protein [Reyranella sp.]
MSKKDDLALVASALRRARAIQASLAALALAATAFWFFLWQAGRLGAEPAASLLTLLVCGATGWLAARFIALFRARLQIETSVVYETLKNFPGRIQWMFPKSVYLRVGAMQLEAERIIFVLTEDGQALRIYGITKTSSPAMEAALRRLAPRADFGWSEKSQKRYQQTVGLIVR